MRVNVFNENNQKLILKNIQLCVNRFKSNAYLHNIPLLDVNYRTSTEKSTIIQVSVLLYIPNSV